MGRIYKRNDIWYIQYDGPPKIDGKRNRKMESCGRGANQKDAEKMLRDRLTAIDRGLMADPGKMTLREYLDQWIGMNRDHHSPTTRESYEDLIRLHIGPSLGHIKLAKLKPMHIQNLLIVKRETGRADGKPGGLSAKTVKNIHTLLHAALHSAVQLQLMPINIADAVKAPKVSRPDIKIASEEDIVKLLVAIDRSYYRVPIMLAIATPMRRGEICALKWSSFDPVSRLLTVKRALLHTSREGVLEAGTKTGNVHRVLLNESLVAMLLEHKANQGNNPGEWICLNARGGVLAPKNFDKAYRKIRKSVGVDCTIHGLRHTQATAMLLAGVPVEIVAERLGHSNATTTQNIYIHLRPQHQQKAADIMETLMNKRPSIKIVEG